jgi:hypothetical protein
MVTAPFAVSLSALVARLEFRRSDCTSAPRRQMLTAGRTQRYRESATHSVGES